MKSALFAFFFNVWGNNQRCTLNTGFRIMWVLMTVFAFVAYVICFSGQTLFRKFDHFSCYVCGFIPI